MYGYNVLQMMDVALYVAARVPFGCLPGGADAHPSWREEGIHGPSPVEVAVEGIDFKYDFLRQVHVQPKRSQAII